MSVVCISEGVVALQFGSGEDEFDSFRIDNLAGVTMKEVDCNGVVVWDVVFYFDFDASTDDKLTTTRTLRFTERGESVDVYLKATNALKTGESKKSIVVGACGRLDEEEKETKSVLCSCEIPWWAAVAMVNLMPLALAYAYYA